jgi:hypothetical protein
MKRIFCVILMLLSFSAFTSCKRGANKTKKAARIDEITETALPAAQAGPIRNPGDTIINKVDTEEIKTSAFRKMDLPQVPFKFISIKTKASVVLPGLNQSVNATVRIAKDSLIWLSAGMFGLEGLRALVTKDSVKVQDRVRKQYMALAIHELSNLLHFDASFALLQSMILGQVPLEQQVADLVLAEGGLTRLVQQRGDMKVENLLGDSKNLIKLTSTNVLNGSFLEMSFSRNANEKIPVEISGTGKDIKNNKAVGFGMNHSQISFLDESPGFAFQIPASYTKVSR